MDRYNIKIIANMFILSGIFLFISAVILAILKHKHKTAHLAPFDLKQKTEPLPKNKRVHERIEYFKEIGFSHPEAPYEEGIAKGKDISRLGAGLFVPVPVKIRPGAKIDLELFFEGQDRPTIRIMGEIVWTEGLEDEKMEKLSLISEFFARRVGIRFIDMDDENRQRIEIFIKGLSEKKISSGESI